jgi:hypothetical protein
MALAAVASSPEPPFSGTVRAPVPADSAFVGAGSCASMACHGDDARRSIKRSEYTVWVSSDRHSRAESVLLEPRSRSIVRDLGGPLGAAPETNELCLNCHATPGPISRQGACAPRDGVSCESCHGPASRWLAEHTTDSWKRLSADEKAGWGMRPTKDLLTRASACVECHVGSPGRDVNHDLIAAGHPALRFELASYHAQLPKHWRESEDRARVPDLQARLWAVGQVASTQAALRLLRERASAAADRSAARAPWPEFAEYDCFACHHDLAPDRRRTADYGQGGAKARPTWATWYLPLFPFDSPPESRPALPEFDRLRALMSQAVPPAAEVAREAEIAARSLDDLLRSTARQQIAPSTMRAWLGDILSLSEHAPAQWDHDARIYLAMAALYHSLSDVDPGAQTRWQRERLESMRGALRFPGSYNSPRGRDRSVFDPFDPPSRGPSR